MALRVAIACAAMLLGAAGCAKKTAPETAAAPPPVERTPGVVNAAEIGDFGLGRIARETKKQLRALPYYGLFDNLAYSVEGGVVTLLGQVTIPALKADAESAVTHIEGVGLVVNEIQVLPVSAADDRLRLAAYRAIYGSAGLKQYATLTPPQIHIVVDNGKVTLDGVVSSRGDKDLAGTLAEDVAGALSVTNNLKAQEGGD